MLAGYATLTNNGDQEITIVAAESENFELVEMHETKEIEGVSSMQPIANFEIAGGETRRFNAVLREGPTAAVSFRLESAPLSLDVP